MYVMCIQFSFTWCVKVYSKSVFQRRQGLSFTCAEYLIHFLAAQQSLAVNSNEIWNISLHYLLSLFVIFCFFRMDWMCEVKQVVKRLFSLFFFTSSFVTKRKSITHASKKTMRPKKVCVCVRVMCYKQLAVSTAHSKIFV